MKKETDVENAESLPENKKADLLLLQRFKEGDLAAFEQLYYRWNGPVFGFMLNTTHSISDAEDIAQETFVRLWKMHENIDPKKNIQALIFVIARRIAVDMFRLRVKTVTSPVVSMPPQSAYSASPHDILEEQETDLLLELAIENMPEKQRNVFRLFYFQNLSAKEISAQSGLSYENVRKHIYNGKRQLSKIIAMAVVIFGF
jgi:RNA polymerase sigma-70 factor (ECF subfamily)